MNLYNSQTDHIFKNQDYDSSTNDNIPDFAFNEKVATVFDDMALRSIPGYSFVQDLSPSIAKQIIRNDTNVYDLGCSTATSLIKISKELSNTDYANIKLIGVDSSPDMLNRAKQKVNAFNLSSFIELRNEDIRYTNLHKASMIISHYTIQFIPIHERLSILKKIYSALVPNGCFLFSEKVHHSNNELHNIVNETYYTFKRKNGYSEIENIRKKKALENVLKTLTLEDNISLLKKSGFKNIEVLHKEICFTTVVAFK